MMMRSLAAIGRRMQSSSATIGASIRRMQSSSAAEGCKVAKKQAHTKIHRMIQSSLWISIRGGVIVNTNKLRQKYNCFKIDYLAINLKSGILLKFNRY